MHDLIAILGRGIQFLPDGTTWALTEDLEMMGVDSGHRRVRVPVDDNDPYCMIGGGEANQLAGRLLIKECAPKVVVCAYGHRAKYLEPDCPTESEVMGEQLAPYIPSGCELVTWERNRYPVPLVPSNTRQEMLNVLDLALEQKLMRIAFLAIGVHVPRAATYLAKHMSVYRTKYGGLNPVILETEEILLGFNRDLYTPRVEAIRTSKAFARNWSGENRESAGISKIVRDVYGDTKPLVVTT